MTTLAFYAPLKPPGHPTPSGDRIIARGLIAALQETGAEITLASTLRSRDGSGDPAAQCALMAEAQQEVTRLIPEGRAAGWRAWVTYHNYYKAPDLIGPAVCAALDIPYLQIESTRARKRLTGPWADFAAAAEAASDAAATILYFTERDAQTLRRDAPPGQKLIHLRPFLNRSDLPETSNCSGPILAVGMMRRAAKLPSYQLIAETLALLPDPNWQLQIVGDGPERDAVTRLMAPFGDRVLFLGALPPEALPALYAQAGLLFWPGVDEAFGMAYLEAQAAGLPVVAQDRPGVQEVLAPGLAYPDPAAGAPGLAALLHKLLGDDDARRRAREAARAHVARHHLLPAAAETLRAALDDLGVFA